MWQARGRPGRQTPSYGMGSGFGKGNCPHCYSPLMQTDPQNTGTCSTCGNVYQGKGNCPHCNNALNRTDPQNTGKCSFCGGEYKTPTETAKPMEAPSPSVSPTLKKMFRDEDELQEFLECLNDREIGIIQQNPDDARALMTLVRSVREDVEGTAKDLEMDD